MSNLYDLITGFIEITGDSTIDLILLWAIGIISFLVASGAVGMIFDFFGKYDSDLMSDCHWIIRLFVFLVLSVVFIFIFKFVTWLFSFKWYVYLVMFISIATVILLVFYLKHRKSKNKLIFQNLDIQTEGKETQLEDKVDLRDICPRCGGRLIKRHGPYGDFYGCENYSSKNCKYTRKFK